MEVITANIWRFQPHSYVIVPTNGMTRKDGACVMGRGLAYEAKIRYPKLPFLLGQKLETQGNHVYLFHQFLTITFPVKHRWFDRADLKLIEQSAIELKEMLPTLGGGIVMPKVGCGNGQLNWKDVEPILEKYLYGKIRIVDNGSGK